MIRSAATLLLLLCAPAAFAQDEQPESAEPAESSDEQPESVDESTPSADEGDGAELPADGEPNDEPIKPVYDDELSKHRLRFDVLAEKTIGTASKPSAYNWRRSKIQIAAIGSFLFELNNFNTARVGAMVRLPSPSAIVEIGVTYAHVWDTPSSRLLAFTPYRQPGRPSRVELDIGFALPLAEGVVTTAPAFFPAVELVFNLYGQFRYIFHPTGWPGLTTTEALGSIFSPTLLQKEIDNLDAVRLDSMQTDPGRYGLMIGFGNDIYFEQGIFISPRLMMALPLLAPLSQTELVIWADFTVAVGVSF